MRTARSRTSAGYLVSLFITPSSQEMESPGKSGRFSFEDRQDLLGHKSERITTHYSAPDIARLIEAAEKVFERRPNTVLRVAAHTIRTQLVTQNGSGRAHHMQVIDV